MGSFRNGGHCWKWISEDLETVRISLYETLKRVVKKVTQKNTIEPIRNTAVVSEMLQNKKREISQQITMNQILISYPIYGSHVHE